MKSSAKKLSVEQRIESAIQAKPLSRRLMRRNVRSHYCVRQVEQLPIFVEVRRRLMMNQTISEVARFIHSKGHWSEFSENTAQKKLRIYVDTKILPTQIVQIHAPTPLKKRMEKIGMTINELEELETLYKIQKDRVENFKKKEDELPIPLQMIDSTILTALRLLEASAQIKMDLGLHKRSPIEMDISIDTKAVSVVEQRYGKESLARVMSDPKRRVKVRDIAQMVMSLSPNLQKALQDRVRAKYGDDSIGDGDEGAITVEADAPANDDAPKAIPIEEENDDDDDGLVTDGEVINPEDVRVPIDQL